MFQRPTPVVPWQGPCRPAPLLGNVALPLLRSSSTNVLRRVIDKAFLLHTLTSQLHSHPTSNVPSTSSPRGRYAVFSGGELQLWEPISEDRTVVPKGPEMSLTDSFGMLEDTEGAAGEAKEEGAAGLPVDALEQFERFHVVSHVLPVLIGTLLGQ